MYLNHASVNHPHFLHYSFVGNRPWSPYVLLVLPSSLRVLFFAVGSKLVVVLLFVEFEVVLYKKEVERTWNDMPWIKELLRKEAVLTFLIPTLTY